MLQVFTVCTLLLLSTHASAVTNYESSKSPCPTDVPGMFYYPVIGDCNAYWICRSGTGKKFRCPEGLHYNAVGRICDVPQNSNCFITTSEKSPIQKAGGIVHPSCPSKDPEEPVLLPHKYDCSKFYICERGEAHEKTCMQGLHFNPRLRVCDYPENAKCQNRLVEGKSSRRCPKKNPELAKLLPHESNCSQFYVCESGEALLRKCPDGLHFNPKVSVCDFPRSAGCEEPNGRNLEHTKATTNSVMNTTAREAIGSPSPRCPSFNGKRPTFYRHETNCSVYYMCGNGLAYEFTCPSKLHFNLNRQTCDVPNKAGCSRD